MKLRIVLLSLLFSLPLLALDGSAQAASHGTRLTHFGDPATTVAVSWNSDSTADNEISYGTDMSNLSQTATAVATTQPAPLHNSFTARLENLTPDTRYYYQVSGSTEVREFRTLSADPCDPFRFVLIGDNRADFDGIGPSAIWADILAETLAHQPSFFVNSGDMVKNGDVPVEWANFIDESETGWSQVPSLLTMGNHDEDSMNGDGALYNQLYEHPRNSVTGTEDYYSLDVGPIHFVSLNTQYSRATELSEMTAWLNTDLAASDRPWKIVFFHKATYSRGNHSSGEENAGALNAALVPVFDAHDVDFVFSGHSHDYERFAPSVGVDVAFGGTGRTLPAGPGAMLSMDVPDGATGTTYMVSGGAGALTTDVFGFTCVDAACTYCLGFNINCDQDVFDKDVEATAVYDGKHNFAIFDVNADTITVEVWSTAAGNVTPPAILDSFSMTSTDFGDTCATGAADAGPSGVDATGAGDANSPAMPDATGGNNNGPSGGCGCHVSQRTGAGSRLGLWALLFAGLLATRRRRGRG